MNIKITLSILGIVVTTFWAIKTSFDKKRLERSIKIDLSSIAGDIQKIRINPSHADMEFDKIRENAQELEKSEQRNNIIKLAQSGARDVTSTEHMLERLLNRVLSIQMILTNTKEINYFPNSETNN